MPPQTIRLRGDDPPADATLVVRGGSQSLSDELLERAAETNRTAFGFWAISVFLAPGGDLAELSQEVPAIRRRRSVRTARCGTLRSAGFPLLDTTRHPLHFSIVLAELTVSTFDRLRSCFGDPVANPGYRP
ncbi:MAG TPA: hypothetical protein VHT97_03335 [Acidimicrobiales bacterium]|nr:hypothetical protein [Acidimicrobiales bacterium]